MRCEMSNCPNPAYVEMTWGLYEVGGTPIYADDDHQKKTVLRIEGAHPRTDPMQNAKLCPECSKKLWSMIHGAVNAGLMHCVNRPIENE